MAIRYLRKIGEGTYGIVYEGQPENGEKVAIKRNLAEISVDGLGNLAELDILARLKGHPFIVDLVSVAFSDPFSRERPMSPVKAERMKDGKVNFVLEYVPLSGEAYIEGLRTQEADPWTLKLLMTQLLLGVEYCHAKDVTHRDLKPANLLISNTPGEGYRLRICDFGMSQIGTPKTPGVVTSWYRAPEICCAWPEYSSVSDLWSVGCILFELIAKVPYLQGIADSNTEVFAAILSRSPTPVERQLLEKLTLRGTKPERLRYATPIRRKTLAERLNPSACFIRDFNTTAGTFDEYLDLLAHLLDIDPERRYTATQALNHPFFEGWRGYITECREVYPPEPKRPGRVRIRPSASRTWMLNLARGLYEIRAKLEWYKPEVLFHAIELFDRYLVWESRLKATQHETEVRFYVCLYVMHKYFATLEYPVEWEAFVPKIFRTKAYRRLAEEFEVILIRDVAEYAIFETTLLEVAPLADPGRLLDIYSRLGAWEGDLQDLKV